MLLTITQLTTNTLYEYCAIFLADSILSLFRSHIRIHIKQILRMNKMNLFWQERLQLWIMLTGEIFSTADSSINATHHVFQEYQAAVFLLDHSLPIPLVNIQRVEIIEFFVSTNSIHIGIDAISRFYFIFSQCQSLPFCQRMNHFRFSISQIFDRESYRTFHSIEIIINTQTFQYEKRSSHTTQTKFCGKICLKELLNQFDSHFGLAHIKKCLIAYWFYYITHNIYIFSLFLCI